MNVSAYASDDALVDRLGLAPPTYEGPTGIVGVLHDACAAAGMPSASLWAAVPHYVAVVPNPKGSLALLRRLESLIGVTVDAAELEDAAASTSARSPARWRWTPTSRPSSRSSSARPTRRSARPEQTDLPSGDVLAREFQRFLRQRGTPPGDLLTRASTRSRAATASQRVRVAVDLGLSGGRRDISACCGRLISTPRLSSARCR